MDFKVETTDGRASMTFEKTEGNNLFNNLFLSLTIKRGSWWFDRKFGNRLHLIKKNTPDAPVMSKEYIREATDWIIKAGKAVSIETDAERDKVIGGRLNLVAIATASDGQVVTFKTFKELV